MIYPHPHRRSSTARLLELVACVYFTICVALALGAGVAGASHSSLPARPESYPPAGSIAVTFDPYGLNHCRVVGQFEPFSLFVVAYDPPGGMEAYEFFLDLPSGAIVTGGWHLPESTFDFGTGDANWIVGTGGICRGVGGVFVLVECRDVLFLSTPPPDSPVCLLGADPTSFPASDLPGYLVCNTNGELREFLPSPCAVINPALGCEAVLLDFHVGNVEVEQGEPASLPVTVEVADGALVAQAGQPPMAAVEYPITRVEFDVRWDPSIATMTGVRAVDDGLGAPTVELTVGTGTATVVMARDYPPLDLATPSAAPLLWLDYQTTLVVGSTVVELERIGVLGEGVPDTRSFGGSITTTESTVPAGARSFGSLKARWGRDE